MAQLNCVWAAGAVLGEAPCWDVRSQRIVWVDIKGGGIHAYRPSDGERLSWTPPTRICSLDVPAEGWAPPPALPSPAYVGCGDAGLCWIGLAGETVEVVPIAHPESDRPGNRFNDGKMGPDGRYWAGTMDDAEAEAKGRLYAFAQDGGHSRLDEGYLVPNGPAFSPDGATVYHSDSAHRTVYAFDLAADGSVRDKRVFLRFAPDEGHPDGMTTDAHGDLWIAMWDGARIERVAPDGGRRGAIAMPTARPTSCVIVGDEMFVTSASIGVESGDALAGGLFRVVGWGG